MGTIAGPDKDNGIASVSAFASFSIESIYTFASINITLLTIIFHNILYISVSSNQTKNHSLKDFSLC